MIVLFWNKGGISGEYGDVIKEIESRGEWNKIL